MLKIKSNTPSKQSLAGGVLYLYLRVGCASNCMQDRKLAVEANFYTFVRQLEPKLNR